jgi:hypothetical protein
MTAKTTFRTYEIGNRSTMVSSIWIFGECFGIQALWFVAVTTSESTLVANLVPYRLQYTIKLWEHDQTS